MLILVGKQIRHMREEAGFTQEEFAMEIDMDRSYYGKIERGERNVAMLNLIKIADGLSLEVGDLVPSMGKLKRAK